jgi:predicted ATPase/DNA-binding XRE family transcriptional regulator
MSFGTWLRQKRRSLDLTQKAFADQIGCAEITVRRMEADEYKPSKELAFTLFEKLGIPESERSQWILFARGVSSLPIQSIPHGNKPKTNLPASLSSFIGRAQEQTEIMGLIAKNRLVTVVGTGGIGKTRLALQVGQRLLNNYPDGVWFIPLDSLSNPMLVPSTVASIFDIRERPDRSAIEILKNFLLEKTTLFILDSCEHLLEASARLIASLLTHCPNLKIVVTSREVVNMEGEATYSLPSLSIPQKNDISYEQMNGSESVRLLEERAALAVSSFRLTEQNTQTVADICRRIDGIPLAIELAAARVDILQVSEILEQLNHCFDLLANNRRAVLPRHQTMRASMDWSWGLLNEAEQTLMRELSVFAGGWTLESAQAVCKVDALNLTSALMKKSLIMVNQESGRETRFRFHEIVRQYAHEKLIEAGEEENIRTRHLNYFLKLSEQAEPALRGPAQIEWMARLTDERDNIRAALTWVDKTDVEGGLYLVSRLGRFWESFDIREESYWLSTFLQKPESHSYPQARAMALHSHLPVLNDLDQVNLWRSTAKECLELYRTLGDRYGEADVLLITAGEISSAEQKMELFQQALNLAQASGDIWRQARALFLMGWSGSGDERLSYWKRAIKLFRQAGDWRLLAQCLCNTGNFALLDGNLELAQESLHEATVLTDKLKDKFVKADILFISGRVAMGSGDYDQAHLRLQEAVEMMEELGVRLSSLFIRTQLGYLALCEGNLTEAYHVFSETIQNFQKDHNLDGAAFTAEGMAGVYVVMDRLSIAAQLIGWADAMRKKINDTRPLLEQAGVDKIIAVCLAKMDEVAFSDAYDEGQKMMIDEVVALALKPMEGIN